MARNKSEKLPSGAEHLNQAQLDHMRNEALAGLGVIDGQVQRDSWNALDVLEKDELCQGPIATHLRSFYKEQYLATKSK